MRGLGEIAVEYQKAEIHPGAVRHTASAAAK
jgi:hypothetical protein